MKNVDEKTIAIQTHLSMNLLSHLVRALEEKSDVTISEFFSDWQRSIGWDEKEDYSIVNQGVILTHLYGLVVYPKVIFHSDIPNISLREINKETWGKFEFLSFPNRLRDKDKEVFKVEKVTQETDMTLEFLIRKIRNAISHGNVKIYEDMRFDFEDEDGTKIRFSVSELQKFTAKFRECYLSQSWTDAARFSGKNMRIRGMSRAFFAAGIVAGILEVIILFISAAITAGVTEHMSVRQAENGLLIYGGIYLVVVGFSVQIYRVLGAAWGKRTAPLWSIILFGVMAVLIGALMFFSTMVLLFYLTAMASFVQGS